jgi:hypothetical protein
MLFPALLAVGLIAGALIYRAVAWLRWELARPSFLRAGFEYARCGPFEGWLNRDCHNDDWIIWSIKHQCMFRGDTPDAFHWVPCQESREQCIRLGKPRRREISGRIHVRAH